MTGNFNLQRGHSVLDVFEYSCGSIEESLTTLSPERPTGESDSTESKSSFQIAQGVDLGQLNLAEHLRAKDSGTTIWQAASQMNALEALGNTFMPVTHYYADPTQGPMAWLATAGGANAQKIIAARRGSDPETPKDGAVDFMVDLLQPWMDNQALPEDFYKNGYLKLHTLNETQATSLLVHIKNHMVDLKTLPTWVSSADAPPCMVFPCAAPSFQGPGITAPDINSGMGQICLHLVVAQYTALARCAVIQSLKTGQPVALNLTMLGQGAFKNPPEVMKGAYTMMNLVLKEHPHATVNVFWHAFNDQDVKKLQQQVPEITSVLQEDAFKTALKGESASISPRL